MGRPVALVDHDTGRVGVGNIDSGRSCLSKPQEEGECSEVGAVTVSVRMEIWGSCVVWFSAETRNACGSADSGEAAHEGGESII